MYLQKRTWAEISLKNIEYNFNSIKHSLNPDTKLMGIVKANAYGHGATPIATLLQNIGCEYMAVATLEEGLNLRQNGIHTPILILGRTAPKYTEEIIDNDLTQSLSSYDDGVEMSKRAHAAGKTAKVHLKLDSGMGRLGFICHDGGDFASFALPLLKLPGLDFEGVFTHFAVSEILGEEYTMTQFNDFTSAVKLLEEKSGVKFKIKHCTNSGAMLNYKNMHLDMVRPGIALYGAYPGSDTHSIALKPVMELKSKIVQLKDMEQDFSISYGRTYKTDSKRKIAVIPIGYADGLHRVLSNKIDVLLHGKRVPQVGNICMDMCMIDVSSVPDAAVGDTVTLFGKDGDEFISADEMADAAGTISYEIFCSLSERVPRIYI